MKKAIIFDFDGVIHDTFHVAYGTAKELYPGMTVDEYKDLFNGNVYANKNLNHSHDYFFEIQHEKFHSLRIGREIRHELERLKEEYDLHIISSNSEKTLNLYFENNGIFHIFKDVLGYETHKSKHEKFLMLLKKHKLNPDECIFITDTLGDILEANNVGMETIAVDYGFHEKERLSKGNPKHIISDFKEIRKLMN